MFSMEMHVHNDLQWIRLINSKVIILIFLEIWYGLIYVESLEYSRIDSFPICIKRD